MRGIPKCKRVNIRIPVRHLEAARRLADRKGLSYQTYMKMLLHQAVEMERGARQFPRRWTLCA